MVSIVEPRRQQVADLCRRFHVRRLEIFGSAARGDFDPERRDLDFAVEFIARTSLRALDAYFGLKEALEDLSGRPVDLVMPAAVTNPYFRADLERTREVIYAS